ncbi:unnamed protein product, partial [Brassica rapa]
GEGAVSLVPYKYYYQRLSINWRFYMVNDLNIEVNTRE